MKPRAKRSSGSGKAGGQRGSILLVEDDNDIREIVADVLEASGYRVVEAKDGLEGLEVLARERSFRLIMVDLVMPHMDGWEFRRRQKAMDRAWKIPAVAMSAAGGQAAPAAREFDAFLPKPFNVSILPDIAEHYGTRV